MELLLPKMAGCEAGMKYAAWSEGHAGMTQREYCEKRGISGFLGREIDVDFSLVVVPVV